MRFSTSLCFLLLEGLCISAKYVAIKRTGWTVTADSSIPGNEAEKLIDGNPATFWASPAGGASTHTVTFDMKKVYVVNGLRYLPRQDGQPAGHIGQHTIELSTDGTNFAAPVVIGTYLEDARKKTSYFSNNLAQFVRLTAIGTSASGAEINIMSPDPTLTAATFSPPPIGQGRWDVTVDFPIVPVAVAVLSTGKMLAWSSYRPDDFHGLDKGFTDTALYDLSNSQVSARSVANTQHDMFCPGISFDGRGALVVTGGNNAPRTSIYDPNTDNWVAAPDMTVGRGYQSSATTSDGRVFTIGGSWSGGLGGKDGEIYDPATNRWTPLPGCPVLPMLTADNAGVYRQDNHAWLFGWKNGAVFQAGPSKRMNWYGTTGTGSQTDAGARAADKDSMNGNAVMYDALAGKILTMGGAPDYSYSSASAAAHIITIGEAGQPASAEAIESMSFPRGFANGVLMADGKVLVVGGQTYGVPFSDDTAILIPEIWDPATRKFSQVAPISVPRNYHSVGILLPDGTIFNGGGGLCGACATNHFDGQIYSPPYLFDSNGQKATRPQIRGLVPNNARVGATISVTTDVPPASYSLIRYGSSTHTVNTDQRFFKLDGCGLTTCSIKLPADSGVVTPGRWMVFALSAGGVPSTAQDIFITI